MRSLRFALLQRGLRMCGPQCVRPCGEAKGAAGVVLALRCVAMRRRHLRTCSRAAHSLGAKAARPSCARVLYRIAHSTECTLAHTDTFYWRSRAHNLQHTRTQTHALTHTHTLAGTYTHQHTHIRVRSACGVLYDKLPLYVRGLHDFHGEHHPPSAFEATWSDPAHKAHRTPLLRGPLLGMRTACEYSGYPL